MSRGSFGIWDFLAGRPTTEALQLPKFELSVPPFGRVKNPVIRTDDLLLYAGLVAAGYLICRIRRT